MYNIADTETNGFYSPNKLPDDPTQGRIVQLAAVLTDAEGNELEVLNTLIKPDGWVISERLVEIHGITTEMCHASGIPMREALLMLGEKRKKARLEIYHNADFDTKMIRNECLVYGIELPVVPTFCTMLSTTDICCIPKTRGSGFKWPKLQEIHKHFFGVEFDDAHDALADVRATKRVYFHMHPPVVKPAPVQESASPVVTEEDFGSAPAL